MRPLHKRAPEYTNALDSTLLPWTHFASRHAADKLLHGGNKREGKGKNAQRATRGSKLKTREIATDNMSHVNADKRCNGHKQQQNEGCPLRDHARCTADLLLGKNGHKEGRKW